MAQKVTSTDIKLALKEFHNGKPSYFITECKTCSTYFPDPQGLLKFDGLAITKSYTKPNIIGYEIKVSRNDFLQDNKWHLYLTMMVFVLLNWVVYGMVVLDVVRGVLVCIMPPLIAIGLSAVACCMCLRQRSVHNNSIINSTK